MGLDLTGVGSIADAVNGTVGTVIRHFLPPAMSDADKLQAETAITEATIAQVNTLVEAQKSIIVAELTQDDKYTKRARPSIVYIGLLIFLMNGVLTPLVALVAATIGHPIVPPAFSLPEPFWTSWMAVTGVYAIGRTAEKLGSDNPLIKKITGGK
ncbi:MAG: holin family protein [Deltaproteobacteria bacterium]|nr:holin family protein [Deltaproteobacteria bacterium]